MPVFNALPAVEVAGQAATKDLDAYDVTLLGLPVQMTLMYSNPALCAVFAWILGTEAVTCICIAGVTASVAGVVFIAQPPFLFGEAVWDHTRMLGADNAVTEAVQARLQACVACAHLQAYLDSSLCCRKASGCRCIA